MQISTETSNRKLRETVTNNETYVQHFMQNRFLKNWKIYDYLYITIIYKSIFTTGTSHWTTDRKKQQHWTTALSVKSVSGITLSENTIGSLKCPYFVFHYFTHFEKL